VARSDGGGAEEQPRAPARRSRELSASVQCQELRRGTGAAVHDGSTMASTAAQWWQQAAVEERVAPWGEVLLL
jgi:hypothetical protein